MINLGVIGATGSVGSSIMSVCEAWPDKIHVEALAADKNSEKLSALAKKFNVKKIFPYELTGDNGLEEIATDENINHVAFAASGTKTIKALCSALKAGKNVSLANKESIVAAGKWVMPLIKNSEQLRPLDSEHNAIWQCLHGEDKNFVKKIFLTASGGPFRNFSYEELKNVTPEQALHHPVWHMGPKITIDSATLMNKGIELIEAMILFGLEENQVDALISPGSFVHGLVEFNDGSVKMLAAEPDMKLPAASCLFWPERFFPSSDFKKPAYDLHDIKFEIIDTKKFPAIRIAREVMKKKGAYPAVLIAADEIAVDLFLKGKISFTGITDLIEEALSVCSLPEPQSLEEMIECMNITRQSIKQKF